MPKSRFASEPAAGSVAGTGRKDPAAAGGSTGIVPGGTPGVPEVSKYRLGGCGYV